VEKEELSASPVGPLASAEARRRRLLLSVLSGGGALPARGVRVWGNWLAKNAFSIIGQTFGLNYNNILCLFNLFSYL
jgi:hypothetical protein